MFRCFKFGLGAHSILQKSKDYFRGANKSKGAYAPLTENNIRIFSESHLTGSTMSSPFRAPSGSPPPSLDGYPVSDISNRSDVLSNAPTENFELI